LKLINTVPNTRLLISTFSVCFSVFLFTIGQGATNPILPILVQNLGATTSMTGFVVGIFGAGRFLTNLPAGFFAQKFGKKPILIIGPAIASIGYYLTGYFDSTGLILISRLITGLGGGIHFVGAGIYLREISTLDNRGRILSLQTISILVGQTVGPIVGGYIGEIYGLNSPFVFASVALIFAIFLILTTVIEPQSKLSEKNKTKKDSTKNQNFLNVILIFIKSGLIPIGLMTVSTFFHRSGGRFTVAPLLIKNKGFSTSNIGTFFSVTSLSQLTSSSLSGYLVDKLGRKKLIIPGVLIILISLFMFNKSDNYQMILYVAILFGIGEGALNASTNTLFADKAPKGYEGLTMGLLRTFGDLGFMIGPPILGFIIQKWNYSSALLTDGIILAVCSSLVIFFTAETKIKKDY
tara:strand:- start:693 stop:1916 length:1224 start_codon:yes stop_codon:yes gene_type:complete